MRHFLLLAAGVALLDFSSAVQAPNHASNEGRRSAASPPAAGVSLAAAIPAAALLSPTRSLRKLLGRAASTARAQEKKRTLSAESSLAAPVAGASQGSSTSTPLGEGDAVSATDNSSPSSSLHASTRSPSEETPAEGMESRSALEKLMAKAAAVQARSVKASHMRGSGDRRRRLPRRRIPQSPGSPTTVGPSLLGIRDETESPMSLDDVFAQISQVSLFSRKTESGVPARPRKKKTPKTWHTNTKRRWGALQRYPDTESEDDDAPILAVLPRMPAPRSPSTSKNAAGDASSSESTNTPQAALQQLLSDAAGSMGIAAWTPTKEPPPSPPGEPSEGFISPAATPEAPSASTKGSRSALEDLLKQATAKIAAGTRRKKAHRGSFRLGKKNSQLPQKGNKTEDDEPILAVLPRKPPAPHYSEAVQTNLSSVSGYSLKQETSPREALQQLLANSSRNISSWVRVEEGIKEEEESTGGVEEAEDSEEGVPPQVTEGVQGAPTTEGPLPLTAQRLNSSEEAPGPQPANALEVKGFEVAAAANAETAKVAPRLTLEVVVAAAAAWDMKAAIDAARKAEETARAARAAATSARGISALPGPPNGQVQGADFKGGRVQMKWEEDSVSEETTESEESHSNEVGPPSGGWDTSMRVSEESGSLKTLSHTQWRLGNREMVGFNSGSHRGLHSSSSPFFPSHSSLANKSPEGTPSSSEQYEEDSEYGKDPPWEAPAGVGGLQRETEEPAGGWGLQGTPEPGPALPSQDMQQNQDLTPPRGLKETETQSPLKDGIIQEADRAPSQQGTAAAAAGAAAAAAADSGEGDAVQSEGASFSNTEGPSNTGGGSYKKKNSHTSNTHTKSWGLGPAIVFGLVVGVGLCVGIGVWMHIQCPRRAKNDATRIEGSSGMSSSLWDISSDLFAARS